MKLYGVDNNTGITVSNNSIIMDGVLDGDKNFILADNNVNKWSLQTYRGETGRYFYIYNFEDDNDVFTLEETGRVGVNKQSNIMNYHSNYVGTVGVGLNDMNVGGTYTGDAQLLYDVTIRNVGSTDTYRWRKSTNYGTTWTSYSTETNISLTPINIESGITVYWEHISGHTTSNEWQFYAYPQAPQGSLTVAPNLFTEIQKTLDYTLGLPIFEDLTYELNNSTDKTSTPLGTGTTSAMYVSASTKFRAVYVNLKTAGVGVNVISEYWNGSVWSGLTMTDGTTGFTQSGSISFTKPSNWIKNIPTGMDPTYNYYWIRLRSSTNITTAPVVNSLARNGDKRLSVYSAYYDPVPTFSVGSNGNVMIGYNYDTVKSKLTVGNTNGNSSKLVTFSDVLNPTTVAGGNGVLIDFQSGGGIYMKCDNAGIEAKYEAFGTSVQIGAMSGHPLGLYSTNLQRMFFSNAGAGAKFSAALGTNVQTFDSVNPELFKVGDTGLTAVSSNLICGYGNLNNYLQINIKNASTGTTSSSDIVATANNGTETSYYIDMGINGSNFSDTGFTIGGSNDAYLYNLGQNLSVGTGTIGKIVKFHTDGLLTSNVRMTIDTTGVTISGTTKILTVQTVTDNNTKLVIINGVVSQVTGVTSSGTSGTSGTDGTSGISGTAGTSGSNAGFSEYDLGDVSGNISIDWSNGSYQTCRLTGSITITSFSNPANGGLYNLRIKQGTLGGYTVAWPTGSGGVHWHNSASPLQTATANVIDMYLLIYDRNLDWYLGLRSMSNVT